MKNLVFNLRTAKAQAEGCAKVTKSSRMAKILTTLTLLLTLGFSNAWGAISYSGGYIYFDNSLGINSTTLQLCARQVKSGGGTWTGVSSLSNISNTKLYYVANPQGSGWGDIAGWVVISANPAKSNSDFDNWSSYTWCSDWNTYGFNSGSTYLIVPSSTTKNKSVTTTYYSGYDAIPKYNAIQAAKKRDTGTTYSVVSGTYPATLSLQGTYLNGNGTSAQSSISRTQSSDGTAKSTYGAVMTGLITHSYSALSSSYYFEGWGTGSTPSVTTSSHSYNISANTTTYAFFSKKYTLTYDRKGTYGTSTLSASVSNYSGTKTSGSSIPTGHQITFTATPASGYVIEGWYSDAACTVSLENGQNTTYTISSLNANTSVYVKFEQLKTITIKFAHEATAGWVIQGVTKYPTSGGQSISADGTWVTMTFTNVYAVSNIDLAYSGGDWDYLNTSTKITDDCCYNKDGSLNASCCVPRANPTWGTAPASGAIGGSMTATVSGAPAGATITWTSSNTTAIEVSNTGVITYKAVGSATITARVTWAATGDYCAGSYDLTQTINCTSGATVSVERTCAAYVAAGVAGQVSARITFTGTSSGWKYRIKQGWSTGYETAWLDASGTSADWTMTGGMDAVERTYTVELYTTEGAATPVSTANFSVTGETAYETTITAADANGSVSPSGTVYANNNHVHPSITATPNSHYQFKNWTSNNAAASVADDDAEETTVTATAAGYTITANFAGDQYTITYKDQGGSAFSGTQTSAPTTHTYGTATTLKIPTKTGYTFNGWFTVQDCSSGQVGTASAASLSATGYTSNITLYAKWTEKMTTITVNVNPAGAGTLTVGGEAFTPGNTTTAGVTTSRTVVATKANDYNFSSWSVTGNATGTSSTNTYTLKGNGSGSTGTLTANFTPIPCKLYKVSAAKNGTTTDKGAMTYDATEHAYYKDITTDASPYYFRFYYNNSAQYCTDWSSTSGGDAYTSGKQIAANGSKVDCNQSVGGWGDKPAMYYSGESGTTIRIWFDYQNKKTWITADKDKQYVLRGANADDPSAAHGMPGWSATTSYFVGLASGNTGTISCSLNAGEWYHLKVYDMYNKTWYGTSTSGAKELTDGTLATMGSYDDFYFGTTVADSYTFTLDKSSGMKIKVDYPVSYRVQLEVGTVKGNKQEPGIYLGSYDPANKIESGSFVPAGSHVIFVVASSLGNAAKTGYTWCGFFDNAAGSTPTQYTNNEVTTHHIYTIAADAHVYACFYENDYTVTVNAGTGGKVNSLSSTTITGHKDTKANLPIATADPGYYFVNWTTTTGTLYNSTNASTGQINGLTSIATVTANFAPIWTIAGLGGDWDVNKLPLTNTYVDATVNYAYLDIDTLRPNTTYYFKAIQRSQGSPVWWRAENASDKEIKYTNSNTRLNMVNTTGDNFTLKTAGAGRYTFDVNLDNSKHPIKVHYPTSYTVTFGSAHGTVTATVEDATTITTGQYAAEGKDITFTQIPATGYLFKGWYNAESEGSTIACMASDNIYDDITDNIAVYAQYNPKTYTVTLTNSGTGYGSGGQANLTATYDAPFPSITLPTAAEGYAFMGYYSEANGAGTQFTNASGVLLANITDYSDESGNWKYDGTKTLYAYYKKAEITDITLNASIFEPVEADADPKAYVTADPVIAPTPTPYTKLCWELRYSNDNPVAGEDYKAIPVSGDQVKFLLNGLAAGGYKIHVELRTGSTCGAGTLLSSYDKSFSIASDHIVTIQYKCGDFTLKSPTSVGGKPLDWSEVIEAASITGYTFNHWEAGEGVTIKDDEGEDKTTSTDATIQIKAIYDSKLTAVYTKKRVIYFYNTLGWSNVYVYFYSNAYWNNDNGTGSQTGGSYTGINGQMLPIEEGSPIYYFDAEAAGVNASYTYVSFTELHQNNTEFFEKTGTTKNKVIYRGDYKSTTLPMFVPLTGVDPVSKNSNKADYYNEGYWMNYPENTGYTLKIYSSQDATTPTRTIRFPFSADTKMPLKLDVELNEAATNYYYTIYREDGQVLSADYGMNKNYHSEVRLNDASKKISIKTTAPGIYKYSLVYMNKSGTKDYYISVDYPIVENDYRVLYSDNAQWSQSTAHGAGWSHPSDVVRKNTDAEVTQYDTVSFYISKGEGITASMKFQYAKTIVEAGTITWKDVTGGGITLSDFSDVITAAGVYNFIIKQEGTDDPVVEKVEPYTGNFYIRTDGAGSTKWDNYQASDHQMTYTEFSMSAANSFGDKYSHYFMHWSPGGTNIKFVVANDYSPCISDTLEYDLHDWGNLNAGGQLKHEDGKSETEDIYSANVRFMYNYKTNKISRAYVSSSTNASRLFLVLRGNEVIKDENGTAVNDQGVTNGAILSDKENWIYERILYIKPNSRFKLFACYAEASPTQSGAQYFRGAYDSDNFTSDANSVILISGSGSYQKARVLYDFKTNRLVCAWLPSDEPIDETLNIDADVMVIRDHQEAAECITFSGGSLTQVKTVYGAMKFNRWTLNNRYRGKGGVEDNNKDHCDSPADIAEYHGILPAGEQKSVYERSLYFISFPFDVKVSEIFGFGTYGKHWVLEYYDGLNRAKNGYWIDSPANWKYVTPSMAKTYELKAYEGYILCLSLGRMAYDNTEIWPNNISNVELYFPSKTPMANIQTTDVTIPGLSDEYRCTINREGEDGDRRIKDSYWRCLGVPSYDMYAGTLTSDGSTTVINWQTDYSTFPFLYAWNMNDNTLTPQSTNRFSFKPMHAYLTQIGTAIHWTNVSATPAVMARQTEEPTEYNWCLTLNAGEQMIDQTYVRMSTDEVITNEFDFGQDLSKELNTGRSDIYSFIGNERAAANSLQMNTETTTIVPLGLNIEATGDYTFSIPDGTNGVGITLIDEETGIRTSLSALDYTVELAAGDYTERFWLEISPVKGAETGIDPGVDARENGVRKVMIDGLLYIVRDGKMYDATGKRVE